MPLNIPSAEPAWFSHPAVGRLTVNNRRSEAHFDQLNQDRDYHKRVRPMNFGMILSAGKGQPGRRRAVLVAPLNDDPAKWNKIRWADRTNPDKAPVRIRTSDPAYAIPGTVPVQTYRQYFTEYRQHVEAKAAAPDGKPCLPESRGLLQPLVVEAETVVRIGKEAARLTDAQDAPDEDDRIVVYRPRTCRGCDQPVEGRRQWCSEACRKRESRRAQAEFRTRGHFAY